MLNGLLRVTPTNSFMARREKQVPTPADGTTITTLPTGAHTLLVTNDIHGTDGTANYIVWGSTYSAKPAQLLYAGNDFYNDGVYVFAFRYQLTVPAGGSVQRAFAESVAFGSSTASSLSASAEKAFTPHLLLTSPASKTSDHTPTIKGRLTNAVNGYATTVKLTIGTKSKTVKVSPSGTFSTSWTTLAKGKHTVKAVATDPSGRVLRASRTFTII